tara:strand:+ start:84 stop:443 length:360 start_codon:yes stop_codon:yes gene_type:complete
MSLMPAYYTTNNTKKRKAHKKSQKQLRLEQEHQAFIDRMKRTSVSGSTTASKPVRVGLIPTSSANSTSSSISYHSSMAKKEEKVYTGNEIIGIAQMHKSNAVPIRNKKSAEDVAKMRRG